MNCFGLECSTLSFPALAFELCAVWGNMGEAQHLKSVPIHMHTCVLTLTQTRTLYVPCKRSRLGWGSTDLCRLRAEPGAPCCFLLPPPGASVHRTHPCPLVSTSCTSPLIILSEDLLFFLSEKHQQFWIISLFAVSWRFQMRDALHWATSEKFFLFVLPLPWVLLSQPLRVHLLGSVTPSKQC